MKVAVLGAGGIVGQHMMMSEPADINAVYTRREAIEPIYESLYADRSKEVLQFLNDHRPDVIVNLVGENNVDVVERMPEECSYVNEELPALLSSWCKGHDAYLIQVSTQGVFSGDNPPYKPEDEPDPITRYGQQKARGELWPMHAGFTVARLTFVVGVRPFAGLGRENPLEHMIKAPSQVQVDDRYFSPVLADDAAKQLWQLVLNAPNVPKVCHIGEPVQYSRYGIASMVSWTKQMVGKQTPKLVRVGHDHFEGIAPRPKNTTWTNSNYSKRIEDGIIDCLAEYDGRGKMDLETRANEISLFLQTDKNMVRERLAKGFHHNHALVAEDFRAADTNVDDPDSLLKWYRNTTAYIYELSAYHLETGFNYSGMCKGLADHLQHKGAIRPLALGDGIGDLTLEFASRATMQPTYHDLAGSKTAEFAQFRFKLNSKKPIPVDLTDNWHASLNRNAYDAIVALDFFEHLVNVEEWVISVYQALKPGGLFLAQNAFGIGDAEHGDSIPMHLSVNNRFTKDWDPLLKATGFEPTGEGTWWKKKEVPNA